MNQFDLESVPFFPFNQLYLELEGYLLEDRLYFKFGSSLKKEILTNAKREFDYSLAAPGTDLSLQYINSYEYQKVLTLPNQFSYNFGDGSSLSSYIEFQWISNKYNL